MAKNKESILSQADNIVNNRSEEKERMYGPFSEGMRRAAMIATGMTGKEFKGSDVYAVMVALKLSRHSYSYRQDNLLDACAYLGALDNYVSENGYGDSETTINLEEEIANEN
jgi:hypothetical protein